MFPESSKQRPLQSLPLDRFHDAEGLPIPSPFDSRPERPTIFTGDSDDTTGTFESPDLDQKISQHLLEQESGDLIHAAAGGGFDFYESPAAPSSFENGDFSQSPAAMFLSAFSPPSAPVSRLPDDEGEMVAGYRLGPVIGYGGFSTIRRASSSSGGTVAVKIVRRADITKQSNPTKVKRRLDHEASVWSSLSHEHILPLFSAVHTSYADFFVTLYCPAGSLFDILKRDGTPALPQDDAGMMFRQVVRGLRYLHEVARLVHRDIKLENVLVDEMGVCRIGDFGMSRNIGDLDADDDDDFGDEGLLSLSESHPRYDDDDAYPYRSQLQGIERRATSISSSSSKPKSKRQTKPGLPVHLSMIRQRSGPRHRNSTPTGSSTHPPPNSHRFQSGSLPYAAPELLMPQYPTHTEVDPAQDIWALGVMLYALLTGRLPFMDSFEPRLQMKILHGVFTMPPGIGRGAELVLSGCIDKSPSNRWTVAMVDEVAWGVGWGAEEGSPGPDEQDIEAIHKAHANHHRSASRSISRSRNESSTSGIGPARRRSTSRARRSLSRASGLSDRTTSTRNTSRSVSRNSHPRSRHSYSALTDSIISTTSSISVPYDPHHESALVTSPAPSRGRRGRESHVRSASRSPSPSVVPMTPLDFAIGRPLPPVDDTEPAGPSLSRGRKQRIPDVRTPRQIEQSHSRGEELDSIDEVSKWTADVHKGGLLSQLSHRLNPLSYLQSDRSRSSHSRGRDRSVGNSGNVMRAGSTPPATEDPQSRRTALSGPFFRDGPSSSSLLVPPPQLARSRSVGYDDKKAF